jgi:cell shape-determining protein MreD
MIGKSNFTLLIVIGVLIFDHYYFCQTTRMGVKKFVLTLIGYIKQKTDLFVKSKDITFALFDFTTLLLFNYFHYHYVVTKDRQDLKEI